MINRNCRISGESFEITSEDEEFYKQLDVPLPTLCPNERQRRRLAWRNERTLYYRNCDATGKRILSIHSEGRPFPVYENDYWWSDKWDPLEYGRDFDFNKPFFEQFHALQHLVPQFALTIIKPSMENSDYCNQTGYVKNCYLIFDSRYSEDCMYSKSLEDCKDCLDCLKAFDCELCYECSFCINCYRCSYLIDSQNSSECQFSYNLIGCESCFGCTNLRNKKYYFNNEPCTSQEEYQEKVHNILNKYSRDIILEKFMAFRDKQPAKWMTEINTENCIGDYLINCKECIECYDSEDLEKCKHCFDIKRTRDHTPSFLNYDVSHFGGIINQCYECCSIGGNGMNRCLFCENVWSSNDAWYSRTCTQSSNLFGCISLKNKKYCILNKQYTKEEYEELVPRIIEHMKSTNEYGEFFPIKHSPYKYNETLAQEYFPITEIEAEEKKWQWKKETQTSVNKNSIDPGTIPSNIEQINDDILNKTLICIETGKPYAIIQKELAFYRKLNLPIPKLCFEARHQRRMQLKNPRNLKNTPCAECGTLLKTALSETRAHCQKCYLEKVT